MSHRARDLGIQIGLMRSRPFDAITDVRGVRVMRRGSKVTLPASAERDPSAPESESCFRAADRSG